MPRSTAVRAADVTEPTASTSSTRPSATASSRRGSRSTPQEKVEIAHQLARLGVDVIEAGFPITSPGDYEAVEAIARQVEGPVICGLARTHKADIDAAWGAIKDAERPRIHTFISTSDIHITHQLQTTRDDVKGQTKAAVALARSYCDDVEFSPMDATRAEIEFTAEVCAIAVAEGATVINIPDTVGYTTPEEYGALLRAPARPRARNRAGRASRSTAMTTSGMAVANSYAGVRAGARQVECAVNGIGERAGNCSLEEIVMLLRTRRDEHGFDTGSTLASWRERPMVSRSPATRFSRTRRSSAATPSRMSPASTRTACSRSAPPTRSWIPRDVGLESNSIVLGKHSGRHALRDALEQLGFKVEGNALNQAFKRFKEIADKKKQLTALDLEAIVSDQVREARQRYELAWLDVEASTRREPVARVAVTMPDGS